VELILHATCESLTSIKYDYLLRAHPKKWLPAAAPPPPHIFQNRNLKSTGFVDTMISEVFHDLLFSLNQTLKSADLG
jgi:hypothetical protein